ncbi:AMP-binding protein [Sphingomicrobium nitratireducens]|uniref:AMP-binding protein n=1 Tax=Sphingomicrobium nitratireducens TaxID=2964666 RepID=UPI00223F9633|nr:AMP-binding protein [Sphingomicrobium nitratireducens]
MGYDSFVRDRLPPEEEQPEFLFDLPELHYPLHLNAAHELLKGGRPGDPAVVNAMGRWTFAELDDFSGRIARYLVEQQCLEPGNRVLLRGPNGYTLFACWLGVLKAGGVVVATMPMLRPGEIATVIDKAEISHALVDSRFVGDFRDAEEQTRHLRSVTTYDGDHGQGRLETQTADLEPMNPHDTRADDPALIAFTSGTTGVPKGCVHFHRDVLAPCDTFARHLLDPGPGQVWFTSAPIAFTFGLGMSLMFPLRFGAAAATLEQQATPDTMIDHVVTHGITHLATAPTAYKALVGHPDLDKALRTLTTCVSAGEHLPQATWQAWKERTGLSIVDGIGSTEMMHIFIAAAGDDIRPGSTGKAVPGYQATVLDEDDQPMNSGEGRLAVKGPTGCRYLADSRQADYVANGWNVTGDTYEKDTDGYFWYRARSDDMIVTAGYNVGAPEVENALLAHDAVAECAVIGVPCEQRGQKIKAFVVPADGATPGGDLSDALKLFVKEKIAPYKYPREIEFCDALPKTATGKLRRVELREE